MKHFFRLFLAFALVGALAPALPAMAEQTPPPVDAQNCYALGAVYGATATYGPQGDGSVFCTLVPLNWNGDLVIFAHGYVDPTTAGPVTIPYDQLILPDKTTTLPGLITSLDYAFGITSYSKKGLAVAEGVKDVVDLVAVFKALPNPKPLGHVYLVGASEGGLVTTLAVEQYRDVFSGGVATCGPIGDFGNQINYCGDFRVVFDALFPTALPPTAVTIPDGLNLQWETYTTLPIGPFTLAVSTPGPLQLGIGGMVLAAEKSFPYNSLQLINVTKAAIDLSDTTHSIMTTTLGILGYNILATNDGKLELGGQPFGNTTRVYRGSLNDTKLNSVVLRYSADSVNLAPYTTSGRLTRPLVTLHNTGDPIVPYWHEDLYRAKLNRASRAMFTGIPVFRYGHCNFNASEALFAFWLMTFKAGFVHSPVAEAAAVLPDAEQQNEFINLAATYTGNNYQVFLPITQK